MDRTCDEDNDGDSYEIDDLFAFTNQPGNFKADAINIYVYGDSCGFSGVYGGGRNIYVRSLRFDNWHTVHEMGHLFGLRHTHQGFGSSNCERVTRDPNNPKFNATTAGDRVVDTEAMPTFTTNPGQFNSVDSNCNYVGFGTDCDPNDPEAYVISPAGVKNIMGNGTECADNALQEDGIGFTSGQGIRMQETIIGIPSRFAPAETTIASLYEPYKGEYRVDDAIPYQRPLFQPGFDYWAVRCCCDYPEPSDYSDTSFSYGTNPQHVVDKYETDYSIITHPNHTAIRINSLPNNSSLVGQRTRKCYDNNNFSAKDGNVMRFNDGTFNANVTVTPKDSIQINDPHLIEDLQPGLYKIERNYHDGSVEETVIQKTE